MLCLWSLPGLDGLELALNGQGWFSAGHSLGNCNSLWSEEEGAGEEVLTGVASRPGARSHLQQSEGKHVRLCQEPGHEQGLTPAPAPAQDRQGLVTSHIPRESWGQGGARLWEAELDPWEEPARGNAGNEPARLGGSWLGRA